ncbi:MAG: phosphoribosylanthranilate isomerase [Puniceicoccales bacterium]|jgi:phosphoribosylanthranilate isomerase|nr:phosphoribosylanthranilate isomerase [Puniceicoccales bacterium]
MSNAPEQRATGTGSAGEDTDAGSTTEAPAAPATPPVTVKVCGITRPQDAADALTLGVALIGVNRWEKSPRYVPDAALPALLDAIPRGRRVFVDVAPDDAKLAAATGAGGVTPDAAAGGDFDYFQIHFDPTAPDSRRRAEQWARLAGTGRLWLAPRVAAGAPWPDWVCKIAGTVLFDGHSTGMFGGTGRTADWPRFRELRARFPRVRWLLAGGLGPDNLADALRATGGDFFDLNSGIETAPGIKSAPLLARALATLREAR